jgi:hypothetical protein
MAFLADFSERLGGRGEAELGIHLAVVGTF